MNARSTLEETVMIALRKRGSSFYYERYKLPVTIDINTEPDLWLPEQHTVVEIKGLVANAYETRKLIATHKAVAEGIINDDVLYNRYIVGVQVSDKELDAYGNSLIDLNSLWARTSNGSYPKSGLRLIKTLLRAGVRAVPITHRRNTFLLTAIDGGLK